ncbi:LacI family transcriptional regulator [Arthrobacter sp. B1I2]|nr:LacI family transcriptional regulator [Arthrobacter sp. B1I2]
MSQEDTGVEVLQPGSRKHPVTIYDIAKEAGVSPSTVSRVFSRPERVSAATAKRIRDAAAALNFRINPLARALPTGRTGTLGLLLSDITNPVYFNLVRGAGRVASAEGYTLVLAESQEVPGLEAQAVERLLSLVDGLVLVGARLKDEDILRFAERKPVVLVNRTIASVPHVVPDITPGIKAAINHLVSYGHRSVAFLSGPATSWMSKWRWETIMDEALQCGMSVVEIGPSSPTFEGGAEGLRRVRASGVTAVLTFNDVMAIGLLTACEDAGIAVPEELSIVGFDDIFVSEFTAPSLTSIRTPLGEAGENAFRRLVSTLKGIDEEVPSDLATGLIIRKSTGPSRRN